MLSRFLLQPTMSAPAVTAALCAVIGLALLPAPTAAAKSDGSEHRAVVRVNDEPITDLEVKARMSLMMIGNRDVIDQLRVKLKSKDIGQQFRAYAIARKPRTQADVERLKKAFVDSLRAGLVSRARPQMRKKALEELIEERLKVQAAKKLNITISKEELDRVLTGMAQRNKMTLAQFAAHVRSLGTHISSMRSRVQASLAWGQVIRRQFSRQISVSQRDIDEIIATENTGAKAETVNLKLQRLTLQISGKTNSQILAKRMAEGEALWKRFRNCATMASLAKAVPNTKFENLGLRAASTLSEPARSLVLNAKDEQMAPPVPAGSGVELYAVCGRSTTKGSDKEREEAQSKARQREFEILAKRHILDLRQSAFIEYL